MGRIGDARKRVVENQRNAFIYYGISPSHCFFIVMSITHVHVGHPPPEWESWEESNIIHFHKFKSLPSGKNEYVTSQDFRSCNNKWRVQLYPSGDNIAKAGYMSIFLEHRSPGDFSVQFHMSIKDSSGFKCGPMRTSSPSQFTADIKSLGYPDFVKLQNNFLTNGSLTVEVRMKPEECDTCRHFIPRNPFADQMFSYSWMKRHLTFPSTCNLRL